MQRQNKATKHYPVGPNIITTLLSPAPFSAPRDSRAAAPAPPQPGWAAAGREAGPVPGFPKGFLWAQVPQPSRPSSLRSRVTPCGLHTRLLAFLNNPFVKLFPNHPLCGDSWLLPATPATDVQTAVSDPLLLPTFTPSVSSQRGLHTRHPQFWRGRSLEDPSFVC